MHKAGEISKLRRLLHSISEELITDEVESLKYLCGDHLTRAKLEKIDNAKQLFVSITEVIEGEEEQLKFFTELFETISRRDLKAKVEEFQSRQGEVRDAGIQGLNVDDDNDDGFIAPSPVHANPGRAGTLASFQYYALQQEQQQREQQQQQAALQAANQLAKLRIAAAEESPLSSMPSSLKSKPTSAGIWLVTPHQNSRYSEVIPQPPDQSRDSAEGIQTQMQPSCLVMPSIPALQPDPSLLDSMKKHPLEQKATEKYPLLADPTGKYPSPQNPAEKYPTSVKKPLLQDSIGNYPIPQDTTGNRQTPQNSMGNSPIPQDFTGNHPIPQDFAGNHPIPWYSTGTYPIPQDSTGNYPMPQASMRNNPIPPDFTGNHPTPQYSTGDNPIPQDSTGSHHPLPQDSTGNYSIPQVPTGNHPVPPCCSRNDNIPFGQQVTEEVEPLNNKIELANLLESTAKPPEFSNSKYLRANDQDTKVPNRAVESRDQPDKGSQNNPSVRQMISTSTTSDTSSSQLPTFVEQEKVPVERCMSTDFSNTSSQCFHQKCPVEMSYDCIREYFQHSARELGKGGFGVVYEGNCKFHGQDVVVKQEYSAHLGQAYSAAQLKREKRVGYIKHPHLMPLYAFSEEKGKPCCLMYPKMHSDLQKALRKDSKGQERLSWEKRVRIALHTARALQYLHTEVKNERIVRQEIVHMDVKPANIFLDKDFNARLGDPGMSQELPFGYTHASISQTRGTEGYLDVYMDFESRLRPINDIFSLGVVMLELLTQRKAVEVTSPTKKVPLHRVLKEERALLDPERLMGKAKKGVWPDSGGDRNYTKEFASIAIDCLKHPDKRAKLPDICKRLQVILEKKKVAKALKPKEAEAHCMSCLLNRPAKHLAVRCSGCNQGQDCNYFCVTCLTQSRRNPLECPCHGLAEPLIGGSDTYAVLICGNDPHSDVTAAVFKRDLFEFENVLTDSRIIGVRRDHIYCLTPSSSDIPQVPKIRQNLLELKKYLDMQGKKNVFLYFYFSGHSDQNGNLICSSGKDVLTQAELKGHLHSLKDNVSEFLIILDCCYADGKIASAHLENDTFLVYKSPHPAEETEAPQQLPLESLCSSLDNSGDCKTRDYEDHISTVDGDVFCKAPAVGFTVRQWSSSLSQQESYGKPKGNSFLTEYIIRGLRGAHSCPFAKHKPSNCSYCDTFKAQAKSVGYITAANLETFISKHVKLAAFKAGGRRQSPRIRSLHSDEMILAYYNEEVLHDEIMFKTATGSSEKITVDQFPLTLVDLQKQLFNKLKGADSLPKCAQPKHLQILCDDEIIVQDSYVDLVDFIRQGYDVKCQLRPCLNIVNGPVVLEIQNYKELVINFLSVLQLTRNQDMNTFEVDTTQTSYAEDDLKDCFEENPSLSNFKGTSLANSIAVILCTASLSPGHLTICVLDDSLDCSFIKHLA